MVHNGQHENGLAPEALDCAEHLLAALTRSPLRTATFQGLTGPAREELTSRCPYAPELMKYVVSCALGPGESVTADASCEPWHGEVGLCKSGELGDWATSSPTTPCLEIVSACVLARVNALDKQVAISLRGPSPALSMLPLVPVETHYRKDGGRDRIKSFRPCEGSGGDALPGRDCGWQPRYVGKCEADEDGAGDVTLTVKNASGHQPIMVRVCAGIHGCDHEQHVAPSYVDWLADGTITAPDGSLSFDCPSGHVSAAKDKIVGYYSVMVASPRPQGDVPCDVDVDAMTARQGVYPASESQVFTFREGAFYGNIFLQGGAAARPKRPRASRAAPLAELARAMLTADQFACYSKQAGSNRDDLYFARRLCVNPKEDCFANPPEPCWTSCRDESSPRGDHLTSCKGGPATVWQYPITTYLNRPDDLVEYPEARGAIPNNPLDPGEP